MNPNHDGTSQKLFERVFARVAPWNELRFRLLSLARLTERKLFLYVFQKGFALV